MPSNDASQRRNRRFRTTDDGKTKLRAFASTESQTVLVSVENISVGGLRLDTPFVFSKGSRLQLRLEFNGEVQTIDAVVRWVSPNEANWFVGCEFCELLSDSFLNDLGAAGVIELTDAERNAVAVVATVRQQLEPNKRWQVEVVNCSNGGVCIRSPREFQTGNTLLIEAWTDPICPSQFSGKVRWSRAHGDSHLVGCQLVRPQDAELLTEMMSQSAAANQTQTKVRTGTWVAGALALGWHAVKPGDKWPFMIRNA